MGRKTQPARHVHAWRAGTSIWEMEKRATNMAEALAAVGMSGTRSSST